MHQTVAVDALTELQWYFEEFVNDTIYIICIKDNLSIFWFTFLTETYGGLKFMREWSDLEEINGINREIESREDTYQSR